LRLTKVGDNPTDFGLSNSKLLYEFKGTSSVTRRLCATYRGTFYGDLPKGRGGFVVFIPTFEGGGDSGDSKRNWFKILAKVNGKELSGRGSSWPKHPHSTSPYLSNLQSHGKKVRVQSPFPSDGHALIRREKTSGTRPKLHFLRRIRG